MRIIRKLKTRLFCLATLLCVAFGAPDLLAQGAFPSDKEFYAAVYGAFTKHHPNAKPTDIDFYNNSFTYAGVTGGRLGTKLSYSLTLELQDNGEIKDSYSDIYQKILTSPWESTSVFPLGFNTYKKDVEKIKTEILAIANNPTQSEYEKYKIMSDIEFIQAIVRNSTELAFKDFTKNYLSESVFTVRGRVSDVKEYGQEINGTTYKYLITLSQDIAKSDNYYIVYRSTVYCRFYTNRDDVIRLSKTATTTVKGKMVGMEKGSAGSLFLNLVEE